MPRKRRSHQVGQYLGYGKRLTRLPGSYDEGRPLYGMGKKLLHLPQYGGGVMAGPHIIRPAKRLMVLPGQALAGH